MVTDRERLPGTLAIFGCCGGGGFGYEQGQGAPPLQLILFCTFSISIVIVEWPHTSRTAQGDRFESQFVRVVLWSTKLVPICEQ